MYNSIALIESSADETAITDAMILTAVRDILKGQS